jgi:hypothetical protein
METALLTLPVRCKRDVLRAAQRARQLGRVLGLDGREQAGLACGVFEMTCQATAQLGRILVEFCLWGQALRVRFRRPGRPFCSEAAFPALQIALPQPLPLERQDLAWLMEELDRQSPVSCFEQLRQQSQEILQLLVDLRRAESRQLGGNQPDWPAAA